ncbi:hypothetical protein B0T18DRAFT_316891 [Schizothecium vesticola]|uniref:DUF676 domain-containing protein n=1 Tax=Schizothecium vesticola TaxID=314040 RepID=A0AA40KDE1_9PEZI|nr:hypothetical protein B0T18DRAFT_316891 [Schizothecium vesticola]
MGRPTSPHVGQSALQPSSAGNSFTQGSPGYYDPPPYYQSHDPRSSSTQSLLPSLTNGPEGRRTLLLVYLHGFMGNDSSFQSFPAHVHHFLKDALAPTHVIHSKIYPRYKTYKAIDVARDNFSKWLEPHESPTTDVVLLGHSMGGLLAAEVVLQRHPSTVYGHPFRHRILGTISLDAPLLGLHPGIVVSGIASLFRPAAPPPSQRENSESSASSVRPRPSLSPDPSLYAELSPPSGATSPSSAFPPPPINQNAPADPYFNPTFFNDVAFVDRGWFRNIAHFAKKHKEENLFEAAASHIMSHLEFGSCLADYTGLKTRYKMMRELEDVPGPLPPRVRFVNYYTASTGPPKKPKSPKLTPTTSPLAERPPNESTYLNPASARPSLDAPALPSPDSHPSTPRISIEDHSDSAGGSPAVLQILDPVPEPDDDEPTPVPTPGPNNNENTPPSLRPSQDPTPDDDDPTLPEIPPVPTPPVTPDLASIADKDARKLAEKDAKRALKTYAQAVKDRDKALRERDKALEKRRRQRAKDEEKRVKEAEKTQREQDKEGRRREQREREEVEREVDALRGAGAGAVVETKEKKKKEGKFCMLPGKVNGVRDPTWVRVYMEGVDEVGAHTGLFFPGVHYEGLVGDVGSRIVEWVHEDASRRAVAGTL